MGPYPGKFDADRRSDSPKDAGSRVRTSSEGVLIALAKLALLYKLAVPIPTLIIATLLHKTSLRLADTRVAKLIYRRV